MNNNLISIIIPCYNSEETIEKCLKSVVNQDYTNIEIIVINDGSTDGTLQIIQNFKEKDSRIVLINQQNQGVSKARNIGISNASGDFICFVDSDDWVEKEYCSVLLNNLFENDADISIIAEVKENPEENPSKLVQAENRIQVFTRKEILELLLEDKVVKSYPCGKLYRKELWQDIAFPEHLEALVDLFILFKIFDRSEKIVVSDQPLYHYIQYSQSLSHNLTPKRAYHFFLAIKEQHLFLKNPEIGKKSRYRILKNFLKKIFMALKRIIRNTQENEFVQEKKEIAEELQKFLPYSIFEIGVEYYIYVRFYLYFPQKYASFVKK
ncbi:MAG: glycosyltransferase [Flavobacteriaceae bacterium]|jgi:glycosyltransferase involved in cell wall biosynthesis|nr:glycosyltransferase [Flavobacteriaceae bacterium]